MEFLEAINSFTSAKILLNEPLKNHCSLGVGGNAEYFAVADSLTSINKLTEICKSYKIPYFILGNGTNVLVSDKGYNGLVISTLSIKDIFFNNNGIRASCGVSTIKLSNFALTGNLTGLEFLCGIPASVGGAVCMNAGAFDNNISDYVSEVETIEDGKIKRYSNSQCEFGYRTSIFKRKKLPIVYATFSLKKGDNKNILKKMEDFKNKRKVSQPEGKSCGSVFKNGKNYKAGALIEGLGLKDFAIGGAKVSSLHANFILTNKNAKSQDVYDLIKYIKRKVKNAYNVNLKEEVVFLGEFDDFIK